MPTHFYIAGSFACGCMGTEYLAASRVVTREFVNERLITFCARKQQENW